ncbi:hypothetical protein BLNAU_19329 [Blattamonas nauphoetae]|uniref:Transmembrane protein n=1 Tax=Blattamonas nauphoetae TaxID=2049346 RepID=A0ABQ9X1X2_9EUKA|nr:hypothetical protein BLNAU_19329 [Blattamonas nauphoetae]
MIQVTQYVLSIEVPLIYGKGFLWLIILAITFSLLFFISFTQFLLFVFKRIITKRIRIFIFFFISMYCFINALVLCIPFPYNPVSFFLVVDMLPRLLLNVTWILFSHWLIGMMTESEKARQGMAFLHLGAGILVVVLHVVGCVISIVNYGSLSNAVYDPKLEYRTLFLSQLINTGLTSLILILMIIDIVSIARSARSVQLKLFRNLRFLYLVPSIGTAVVYFVQLCSMILNNFGVDHLYSRLSDSASFCLHPEIFRVLVLDHCTIFSLLYVFRYFMLKVSPIVIFLLSFFVITKQTNSTLLMVLYESGALEIQKKESTPSEHSKKPGTSENDSVTPETPLLETPDRKSKSKPRKSALQEQSSKGGEWTNRSGKGFLKTRSRRASDTTDVISALSSSKTNIYRSRNPHNSQMKGVEEFVFDDDEEQEYEDDYV